MSRDNEWNEKLCGCFKDWGSCCYGCWCTPCLFGSNAERIDGSNCCLMCCLYALAIQVYLCWVPHCMMRQKLREKYNLKADPSCGDCPTALFCAPCALCQETREIKFRENKSDAINQGSGYPPVVSQPEADSDYTGPIKTRM